MPTIYTPSLIYITEIDIEYSPKTQQKRAENRFDPQSQKAQNFDPFTAVLRPYFPGACNELDIQGNRAKTTPI